MIRAHLKDTFKKWRVRAGKLRAETYVLFLAYKHPRTPWYAKVFAGLVVAYGFSPIDLVPDFIPILGYLDDLILVPLGIVLARKLIPTEVMVECREVAKIDMEKGKHVNWLMAFLIVLIWISLAYLCLYGMIRLFE